MGGPTRIDPERLSPETKDLILRAYQGVWEDVFSLGEINGVQITVDGRDQPPTIDVRYV